MTDIRVGDWVKVSRITKPFQVLSLGRVDYGLCLLYGEEFVARKDECHHCAPDPLPQRLPPGTKSHLGAKLASEGVLDDDGLYLAKEWCLPGAIKQSDFTGVWLAHCQTSGIDWASYHEALHAEQDRIGSVASPGLPAERCAECLLPLHAGRPSAPVDVIRVCGDCWTQSERGRTIGRDDLPLDARIAEAQAKRKAKIDQLRAELDRKSAKHPWDRSGEWPWEG